MAALLVTFSTMGRLVRELVALFKKPDARALLLWMVGLLLFRIDGQISMADNGNGNLSDPTMRSKRSQIAGLIVALLLPFVVAGLGAAATSSSLSDWYLTLKKPVWNPPSWLFGPVWTVLYLMMGVSSWLVWRGCVHLYHFRWKGRGSNSYRSYYD